MWDGVAWWAKVREEEVTGLPPARRGLGKGLEALIPSGQSTTGLEEAALVDIEPNPRQPRVGFDSESLRELADSIREHGVIQPLIVMLVQPPPDGDRVTPRYRLIAGERRWRAAKMAGLQRVPVVVKEASPQDALQLALVENIQRADLNPLEEGSAYRQLIEEFGLTQEEVATRVGRSRSRVANSLRLLSLPSEVKQALTKGTITEGHARAILGAKSRADQLSVFKIALSRGLSVRQTEEMVRRVNSGPQDNRGARSGSPDTVALETAFRAALGTKVSLARSKRGGRLIIHFYSEEELQRLHDLIVER